MLGLYLGDGMLTLARRDVWKLRISLDSKYPGIIARAESAIFQVAARRAGQAPRIGCKEIYSNWKHWICLFPQHGPGPKHDRRIGLEPWQERLVFTYPDELLAGLIHSDGCRFINRVKKYEYPRYMFSNYSADIRSLFIRTCALVGVDCRPAGRVNISVARRDSVEILDRLVGPKR
ncbi:MAG: transcriptional regulator [Chloroflexota bacterium]